MLSFFETRNQIALKIFHLPFKTVEQAVLQNKPISNITLPKLTEELAAILGIGKTATIGLLGISVSRQSRNTVLNTDILDRASSYISVFARVSSVLGETTARAWLQKPKRGLGGALPIDLLQTRLGLSQLEDMLSALEDGAYL